MSSRAQLDATKTVQPNTSTLTVTSDQLQEWGEALQRAGLDGIASWLMDAGRPIALLFAQFLHAGGPFLGKSAHRIANLLESEDATSEFARYLDSGMHGQGAASQENR